MFDSLFVWLVFCCLLYYVFVFVWSDVFNLITMTGCFRVGIRQDLVFIFCLFGILIVCFVVVDWSLLVLI